MGPDPPGGGPAGWAAEMSRGRSSALFALLAGFTLVILTGRPEPRTGRAGRQAAGRVLIRSAALVALGGALTALDTSVDVILASYGLALALALPLRRLRAARDLALLALAGALVLPQVLYPLRAAAYGGGWADTLADHDPMARISGGDGLPDLLVTGDHPVLTWLPFIVAGMAVARLDLGRRGVRSRPAVRGAALTAAGYGGSWLALHLVPGAARRGERRHGRGPGRGRPVVRRRRLPRGHHPGPGCSWPPRTARRPSRSWATQASPSSCSPAASPSAGARRGCADRPHPSQPSARSR
ncbi:hypothetical protein ABZZ36_17575 [Actinacidiphila glaucinigra]|uniref:hypothetical protein n=1 Tax=Actinacidiphila glaucinigra TaxID=235986 RepID=UPI0033BE08D7